MKWFRSNIRHGARLALLALVIQFALSFGHSHGFTQAAALAYSAVPHDAATIDSQATRQESPANQDRDRHGDDHCAICAIIAMAGNVLFTAPPLLLLPQAAEFQYLTADAEFIHVKSAGAAFQPRAPPAS